MSNKNTQFETLLIDESSSYKTILTTKYKKRKAWALPDNRKITAFLPGTVTDILVNKGDMVIENQTVMKFEAMKMVNNVQTLAEGKVKDIYVKTGDKFPKGFVLLELI